jgi:TIR domain
MAKKKGEHLKEPPPERVVSVSQDKPFVFISHDTRDAEIAEAFENLLRDASGGMLPSFRSSDKKGTTGIPFGEEWYTAVMNKLGQASDVVALLTPHSVGRPWILYEAGVAKGSRNTKAYGVAIGIALNKAIGGPFGQFQNLEAKEDELTKLVLDLIHRNRDADPRQEAVKHCVQVFLEQVGKLVKATFEDAGTETAEQQGEVSVAKMFEEVKVLVRDLPERLDSQLHELRAPLRRMRRHMPPDVIFHELMEFRDESSPALALLIFLSLFRDDLPWIYDLGLDYYRASQSEEEKRIRQARAAFRKAMHMLQEGPMVFELMGGRRGDEAFHMIRRALKDMDHLLDMDRRPRKVREESEKPDPGKP